MKSLIATVWDLVRPLVGLLGVGAVCFLFAAFITPQFLITDSNELLSFESSIRVYLGIGFAALFAVTAVSAWGRLDRLGRSVWIALFSGYLIVLGIMITDSGNRLMDEWSWIRYPTALTLLIAGVISIWGSVSSRKSGRPLKAYLPFLILGTGFLFASFDEIFKLHERAAKLWSIGGHVSATNDLISILYAVGGLGVLYLMWRLMIAPQLRMAPADDSESKHARRILGGIVMATCLYGVSQFCDSGDRFILAGLREVGQWLASAGHRFPDYWYLAYSPQHTLNSLEEVLEFAAAILFLVYSWWGTRNAEAAQATTPDTTEAPGWQLARAGLLVASLSLIATGWSEATRGSPIQGANAAVVGSASRVDLWENLDPKALDIAVADSTVDRNGTELRVEGSMIIKRAGDQENRLPTRLMFRDLRGTALSRQEELVFATSSGEGSFLPHIVWSAPAE